MSRTRDAFETTIGTPAWRVSAPLAMYVAVVVAFSVAAPAFLSIDNFFNILVHSSPVAIAAVGMTFVLLVASIDLSVGAGMFLAGAAGGVLVVAHGWPLWSAVAGMLVVGVLLGWCNGALVARLGASAFIVTLSTMFVFRGAGLWITQTRAVNLPDEFRQLATERWAGIPLPVMLLTIVLAAAHFVLTLTPFGRQLYAIGYDREAARKAGLNVQRTTCWAFVIAGGAAALGAVILVAQLAAVSPNLGQGTELAVIAAAVLGGASLFGGRGTAGGAVLGAVFVQTIRNGLNLVNADPFIYPVVTGVVIFVAVLLDSTQQRRMASARGVVRGRRRRARTEAE